MSHENAIISRNSFNVPVNEKSQLLSPEGHPILSEYEPAFRPLAAAGLAAIEWAGRDNPELLTASPLNNISHPPLHPDFVAEAGQLNSDEALAAQAGAAVLAVTTAYQAWAHATNTPMVRDNPAKNAYNSKINQEVLDPSAQWAAGNILWHAGTNWHVTDLSAFHAASIAGVNGGIRLSAALQTKYEDDEAEPTPDRYYCLNLETSFYPPSKNHKGWATAQVEAAILDNDRFMVVDSGAGFDRLTKAAQVLSTLSMGEAYLVDLPLNGYRFEHGFPA